VIVFARLRDRWDAGVRLGSVLRQYLGRADVIVLGLPRGGVPVAAAVAQALRAPLDVLTVHLEPAQSDARSACEAAAQQLTKSVKAYVGVSVRVNLGETGSIERSIGKAKRVIDKRNAAT